MLTTNQVLAADPHMGYLIDNLPDDVLWHADPDSTEDHPVVTVTGVIVGRFVDPDPA